MNSIGVPVIGLIAGMLLLPGNIRAEECSAQSPCPTPEEVAELVQNVQLYSAALEGGELAEAETLAKKVVELTIIAKSRDSNSVAYALTNLAFVQQEKKSYVPALQNYQAAIDTIEHIDGVLSVDLIRPIQGLGETQLAMGEAAAAKRTFERAVHISHVNSGPRNTDQIKLLNTITVAEVDLGNIGGALDTQKNILGLQTRAVDPESEAMLPALEHHAEWMHRLKLFNRERNMYWQILDLQEKHRGKEDLSLVPTLIALAGPASESRQLDIDNPTIRRDRSSVYSSSQEYEYLSGLDDKYVERSANADYYLRRAFEIATEHPDSNWEMATTTAITIGDFYSMVRSLNRAKLAYTDAWKRLSESEKGLEVRRQELESPKLLHSRWLPKFYENQKPVSNPRDPDEFERGTITAEYDVSKLGKTVNVNVIESQPAGLPKIEKEFVDRLKDSVHRPRMEDGTMFDTYKLTYVYEFFHRTVDDD